MKIGYLAIGDELISGRRLNTNAQDIGKKLFQLGSPLSQQISVGDDIPAIIDEIKRISQVFDLLIVSGGLGPTPDDMTREAVAKWLGCKLVTNLKAKKHLSKWLHERGKEWVPACDSQVLVPSQCEALLNPLGTATGFFCVKSKCKCFFLPGVPSECLAMMENYVYPQIKKNNIMLYQTVWTWGWPESAQQQIPFFRDWNAVYTFSSLPNEKGVQISLFHSAANDSKLAQEKKNFQLYWKTLLKQIPKEVVVDPKGKDMIEYVHSLLTKLNHTLSLAESCTGGLASAKLIALPNTSNLYSQGWITYSNSSKSKALGVPQKVIQLHGAVSEQVVAKMALGAKKKSGSTWAAAISGIAGPSGGTAQKPVGTVCFAIAGPQNTHTFTFHFFGTRENIQKKAVYQLFFLLGKEISNFEKNNLHK